MSTHRLRSWTRSARPRPATWPWCTRGNTSRRSSTPAPDPAEQTELRNLNNFGYGVKGFTLSMIETAIERGRQHCKIPAPSSVAVHEAGHAVVAFGELGHYLAREQLE